MWRTRSQCTSAAGSRSLGRARQLSKYLGRYREGPGQSTIHDPHLLLATQIPFLALPLPPLSCRVLSLVSSRQASPRKAHEACK